MVEEVGEISRVRFSLYPGCQSVTPNTPSRSETNNYG